MQKLYKHDMPRDRRLLVFKGCGLCCRWCSNPEAIEQFPQLGVVRSLCNKCGKCLAACEVEAMDFDKKGILSINRTRCTNCGKCLEACSPKALVMYGKVMTVDEVLGEVQRDEIFYQGSGGGVTLSGGEPLLQPLFALALLQSCREAGFHTAIETAGYVSPAVFRQALATVDYMLFDLKHMDSKVHEKFTGRPNGLILENADSAGRSRIPLVFRMPVIPGVNDDMENVRATAGFLKTLKGGARPIELLPYHRLGKQKYNSLDVAYLMGELEFPEATEVGRIKQAFEGFGIQCKVSQ